MTRQFHACLLLLIAVAAGADRGVARADDKTNDEVIRAARESLSSSVPDPNWYDASNDETRAIDVKLRASWKWGRDWNWNWLVYVVYAAAVALALGLIVLLLVVAVRRETGKGEEGTIDSDGEDLARIEALPVRIPRGADDLLGEARRHYERGDFNEAIIYLFSYELVELDRRRAIRLAKGKTNRQYLREMREQRSLASLVAQTMVAFEDVFFGNHALDRARFEACWSRLDEFHALLGGVLA